jgi:hypothetical protein
MAEDARSTFEGIKARVYLDRLNAAVATGIETTASGARESSASEAMAPRG